MSPPEQNGSISVSNGDMGGSAKANIGSVLSKVDKHVGHGEVAACNGGTHDIKTGLFGIRWDRLPGEVDALNRLVDKKIELIVADCKKKGNPLPPEVAAVLATGKPAEVYKERWTILPVFNALFCIYNLSKAMIYGDALQTLVAFSFVYVYFDFFSGVLHVLHDNPVLMKVPITHDPCLEFQWHHHIPQDIASKSFLEVCGDLNLIIISLLIVFFAPAVGPFKYGFGYTLEKTPMAASIGYSKCLMAYFGQLSHSMSHMPPHRRPSWVKFLQNNTIMLNPKQHSVHHKSYDDNFCIGNGWFNPVMTKLLKFTNSTHRFFGGSSNTNALFWLTFFVTILFVDVSVIAYGFSLLGFK